MKKLLKLAAILLILAESLGACENQGEGLKQLTTLKGTRWKLVGIIDETGVLKELEPKECEECYTLVFNTDDSFSTFSPSNDLGGNYIADYETYSFQVTCFGGTKVGEIPDGDLYADLFWKRFIQSFSVSKNELRLYYNGNKNYLLFKSQQS